jgi:CheY-like chemotaxis protein
MQRMEGRPVRSILVVEDDATARFALTGLLESKGYSVLGAATGEEALASLQTQPLPSLILLDLSLPGMSGWEFLERQRRSPALASVPVAIESGAARPPQSDIPYLAKPVENEELLAAVERLAAARPEVLVVEDEVAVLQMLGVALRHYGFEARLARSGQQAVELYRRHHDSIALVLMDVQMPGLDGPHTLAELQRVNPAVCAVFMSGHTGDYSAEDLLALGAARVLPKPFGNLADLA